MRLIDADALKADLIKRWNVSDDVDFNNKEVWQALENAQSIDIVRCRDCKKTFISKGEIICNHLSGMVGCNVVVRPDEFCSFGGVRDE